MGGSIRAVSDTRGIIIVLLAFLLASLLYGVSKRFTSKSVGLLFNLPILYAFITLILLVVHVFVYPI